jgi:predicted Fe-Mo cluster-binding NifX family protein
MNVIITAQGGDLDALVDPRFGRAPWLLHVEPESGDWEAIDNGDGARSQGGAGVQAWTTVVDRGAEVVITGNVGPNAHKVLEAAGITMYRAGNGVTARQALDSLIRGDLAALEAPTIAGPWTS